MSPRKQGRPTPRQALGVAKEPFIAELIGACSSARNGLSLRASEADRQVEDAFFRAAASLETFLSEWLIRCLSFDATQFRTTYEKRAARQARTDLDGWEPSRRLWRERGAEPVISVQLPILKKHSLEETRMLLGALDDNVTIRATQQLVTTSMAYLVERYARRPRELGAELAAILDATVAIRNVLAHRSARATERMNECLRSSNMPLGLRRQQRAVSASGVGYYLRAEGTERPRFEQYFTRLGDMAHRLAPTDGRNKTICP